MNALTVPFSLLFRRGFVGGIGYLPKPRITRKIKLFAATRALILLVSCPVTTQFYCPPLFVGHKKREYSSGTKHENAAADVNIPASQPFNETNSEGSYNEWIEKSQFKRADAHNERLGLDSDATRLNLTADPPAFESDTIFKKTVEDYATQLTTAASPDVDRITSMTSEAGMFMPCMVGQLEGQFLKMFAQMAKAKTVLDIGTFTGYSALCFAEGLPADGSVVTIENDEEIAAVAKKCFDASAHASKIDLRVGNAPAILEDIASGGQKFDIVFIDADKDNYATYYKLAMDGGLLADDGCILADNSLCALVYDKDDIRRQRLHEFNMMVADDDRVEQVVLTVREGITIIRKKLYQRDVDSAFVLDQQ